MIKNHTSNFFILTGAPGAGKTSLIQQLQRTGHHCVAEPGREILAEQRAINGSGLPEKDTQLFIDLLLARSIEKFQGVTDTDRPIFFDRGVPDIIAYAAYYKLDLSPFESAANTYRSARKVFVLPPWEEIYANDDERKMTFAESMNFQELILDAYKNLDYELVTLPLDTVEARTAFILSEI